MKNYKYTSGGRKVIIVGKLNAQETIVQEIFVSNNQEIPSGENFVVKSLHDAPSESWKERNLREIEENYPKIIKRLEDDFGQESKKLTVAIDKAKERTKAIFKYSEGANDSQLNLLKDFLSGKITHYAFPQSYDPHIRTIEENGNYQIDNEWGRIKVEGIKLISLLGKSDGRLEYRINDYRDGSGGSQKMVPCRSRDEALGVMQEYLDVISEEYLNSKRNSIYLDKWKEIEGINISDEVANKGNNDKIKNTTERIDKLVRDLEREKDQLKELRQLIPPL